MLPALKLSVLGENERETTLLELCNGKVGVIDLWHTKCQKCPAALDKFNGEAENFSSEEVMFIACALSLGNGNKEDVADLGPETWENLVHVFVEEDMKDQAKAAFGYTAVPFYVVFDKTGSIVKMGDSKSVDYVSEIKALLENNGSAPAAAPPAVNTFTLDEDF